MSRARTGIALLTGALVSVAARPAEALSCSFTDVTTIAFGAYDIFSTSPVDTAGTITIGCASIVAGDTFMIHVGKGGASSFFPRRLAKGPASLDYNIYVDAARTLVWGDGTSGTSAYGPVAATTSNILTLYGRVPAHQRPEVGVYGDTLLVTILY